MSNLFSVQIRKSVFLFVSFVLFTNSVVLGVSTRARLMPKTGYRAPRADAPNIEDEFGDTDEIRRCLGVLRTELQDHDELMCSKIEGLENGHQKICSKIENLRVPIDSQDIEKICSKIEKVERDLLQHNETICEKVENIDDDLVVHDIKVEISHEKICSKIENFDVDLETHNKIVCSKLDKVGDNIDDTQNLLCSKIENITDDISALDEVLRDEFEDIREQLEIHDMEVEDTHIDICSKIEKVEKDLSIHDELICSKLADLDEDLEEHDESICSKLDVVKRTLCDKLEDLDMDLIDHDELICSKLDVVKRTLCDKIEDVDDKLDLLTETTLENLMIIIIQLESICDKVLDTMEDIDELSESVHDKLSDLDKMIEDLDEDLEEHDRNICSKLEDLDEDIEDHNELICSKLDQLAECDPIPIVGPTIITEPGHYCLVKGFTATAMDGGIIIDSDNVVLDLNGQTILVEETVVGINIEGHSKIVVSNGIICSDGSFSSVGIKIFGLPTSSSIRIKDITLLSASINIIEADGVLLENCEVDRNQINITNSSHIVSKWCMVRNASMGLGGFEIHNSSLCCFIGCKALNNIGNGFYVDPQAIGMGGTSNVFSSCISQGNAENGFLIASVGPDERLTVIKDCVANKNTAHGIKVEGSNTVMRHCLANGNTLNGYSISGDNCELRDSSAVGNVGIGISNTGIGLVVCNNTSHGNGIAQLLGVEDSNLCTGQQKICSKIEDLDDDLLDVQEVLCSKIEALDMCDFTIKQVDIGDGDVFEITKSGVYCLIEDVSFTGTFAIKITANNVVLDLKGHTISGGSGTDGIVVDGATNVTIKNGNVCNVVENGILISNDSKHVMVMDIKVINAASSAGAGIKIMGSTDVVFKRCEASDSTGDEDDTNGIGFLITSYSNHCILKNCVARNNGQRGYQIEESSSDCCFIQCKAQNNGNDGFKVDSTAGSNNIFLSCVAQKNINDGFEADGDNTVLSHCVSIKNSTEGFDIAGDRVVLRHCVATENEDCGFRFIDNNNCELRDSSAVGNVEVGIFNTGIGFVVCNNTSHGNGIADLVGVEYSNLCTGHIKICAKIEDLDDDVENVRNVLCSKISAIDYDCVILYMQAVIAS